LYAEQFAGGEAIIGVFCLEKNSRNNRFEKTLWQYVKEKMTLLVMTILIALNNGGITYNSITYNGNTYNWFYLSMTLLKTVNQKHICKI
jgi:hypothetical protein